MFKQTGKSEQTANLNSGAGGSSNRLSPKEFTYK